jgi:hypothetical protein
VQNRSQGINESKNVSTKVGASLVAVKLQAVAEIHKKKCVYQDQSKCEDS